MIISTGIFKNSTCPTIRFDFIGVLIIFWQSRLPDMELHSIANRIAGNSHNLIHWAVIGIIDRVEIFGIKITLQITITSWIIKIPANVLTGDKKTAAIIQKICNCALVI